MRLGVDVTGFTDVNILLEGLQDAINPEKVLDEVGAVLLNRIRTRFLRQEDPDGRKWPESQAAKRRKKSGRGGGTLFDTGALFHSIQLSRRGPNLRAIETDVPYSKKHQEGRDVTKRVFLGFSQGDGVITRELVLNRLKKALSK